MEIIGYHYSSEELNIGDTIISEQHLGRMFPLVHGIFKEVNPNLFDQWGYAYPERKHEEGEKKWRHCYLVKAPSDKVIRGDLNNSVYAWMTGCQTDRSLPLKERLEKRDTILKNAAQLYFNPLDESLVRKYPTIIELISDSFVIVEKLY